MKKEIQKNTINSYLPLMIVFIFIAILGTLLMKQAQTAIPETKETQSTVRDLTSDTMKFSISYPHNLKPEIATTMTTLKNSDGAITIIRNATNFDNIEDYFALSTKQNNITVLSQVSIQLTRYPSRLVEIKNVDRSVSRIYYIYTDHFVYLISTENKSLYQAQDMIAKTFRYRGDLP